MKKQDIPENRIISYIGYFSNSNNINKRLDNIAKKELKKIIYNWKILKIITREKLENEFYLLNEKYGTNYKIFLYEEEYTNEIIDDSNTEYLN